MCKAPHAVARPADNRHRACHAKHSIRGWPPMTEQFPRFDLTGQTVLVTAAARGSGRAARTRLRTCTWRSDFASGDRGVSGRGIQALGRRALRPQRFPRQLESTKPSERQSPVLSNVVGLSWQAMPGIRLDWNVACPIEKRCSISCVSSRRKLAPGCPAGITRCAVSAPLIQLRNIHTGHPQCHGHGLDRVTSGHASGQQRSTLR